MTDFSELREVELREVWPNEANDFTPWLSDNLQRLSRVIGIAIEQDDSEVAVDGSSADILAFLPANGSRVVIENQLENTDNDHLGQIMSHLARLEAQTAIWVAREFQPSHLAAIRWLNINTAEDYAFFGVRVRAVRVGEFPRPRRPRLRGAGKAPRLGAHGAGAEPGGPEGRGAKRPAQPAEPETQRLLAFLRRAPPGGNRD